jgi:hypothetical protein
MKQTLNLLVLMIICQVIYGQNDSIDTIVNKDEIFIEPESGPSFPGGEQELFCFLSKNLNTNIVSEKSLIVGKVYTRFKIDTLGRIFDVKVVKHYNRDVDKEIVRVIKLMPNWAPREMLIGYPNGVWVKKETVFTLPIKIPYENQCP